MNLSENLKCNTCPSILSQPVALNCGHSICKKHLDELLKTKKEENVSHSITCETCRCSIEIPENGIRVNIIIGELIKNQIYDIDFGPHFKAAQDECEKLREFAENYDQLIGDSNYAINEYYSKMRAKVDLKREVLKNQVNEISMQFIKELDEQEEMCKQKFRDNKQAHVTESNQLELMQAYFPVIDKSKAKLAELSAELKKLKVDEEKWKRIKKEAEFEQNNIQISLMKVNNMISNSFREGTVDLINIESLFCNQFSESL